MKNLLIASNNSHKISEINSVLNSNNNIKLFSMKDFGISANVIEDGNSLVENALIKARDIYRILNIPTISDDTGLFVNSLNGEPGIYSARYAGEKASYKENRDKLLKEMESVNDKKRMANFESVICFYIKEDKYYFFKGICKGKIINEERGDGGFGYDSIFLPDNSEKTFAELSGKEKNKISHRALALREFGKFIDSFLKNKG